MTNTESTQASPITTDVRVSGIMQGQAYSGRVASVGISQGHVVSAIIYTDRPLVTPAGRSVEAVAIRGADAVAALVRL